MAETWLEWLVLSASIGMFAYTVGILCWPIRDVLAYNDVNNWDSVSPAVAAVVALWMAFPATRSLSTVVRMNFFTNKVAVAAMLGVPIGIWHGLDRVALPPLTDYGWATIEITQGAFEFAAFFGIAAAPLAASLGPSNRRRLGAAFCIAFVFSTVLAIVAISSAFGLSYEMFGYDWAAQIRGRSKWSIGRFVILGLTMFSVARFLAYRTFLAVDRLKLSLSKPISMLVLVGLTAIIRDFQVFEMSSVLLTWIVFVPVAAVLTFEGFFGRWGRGGGAGATAAALIVGIALAFSSVPPRFPLLWDFSIPTPLIGFSSGEVATIAYAVSGLVYGFLRVLPGLWRRVP